MYALFTHSATLAVWKMNYCASDFTRCARYQLSAQGKLVPLALMPSGQLLKKIPGRG